MSLCSQHDEEVGERFGQRFGCIERGGEAYALHVQAKILFLPGDGV
ncbi:hypothetical protein [Propionivibrio sp.]